MHDMASESPMEFASKGSWPCRAFLGMKTTTLQCFFFGSLPDALGKFHVSTLLQTLDGDRVLLSRCMCQMVARRSGFGKGSSCVHWVKEFEGLRFGKWETMILCG